MAHNRCPNRDKTFCARSAPAHPRSTKAGLKLLGFTFDHARANGITILSKFQILHPSLVLTEVIGFGTQVFVPLGLARSRLGQGRRNMNGMTLEELSFHPVEPALSRFRL